ncbi:uncharacterized protein SAPINGB_P005906 [Magnusiomyces paraingens]|uniref:Phosphatidylglycerol/phosphatidylinositol transfer protein n=1 Tax=Magnusiomyces paraingens TaxID=2606893 RepID=A0A5E8C762_9ASCO|nr:uncharacterized protein SAPINGB_P005906 [Saprochaete ingens]VVT57861.1 unnamed protein product [Saprochaete ingens]
MKLFSITAIITLLSAASSSSALAIPGVLNQNPFGSSGLSTDDKPVPGDSPVEICDPFVPKLLTVEHVDLSPNPPERGANLTIVASGVLHTTIKEGSYIDVDVRYGFIRLLTQTFDLCEQLKEVDLECPLPPGPLHITKTVELPNEIPAGKYIAVARAYTDARKPITCLSAEVNFPIPNIQ